MPKPKGGKNLLKNQLVQKEKKTDEKKSKSPAKSVNSVKTTQKVTKKQGLIRLLKNKKLHIIIGIGLLLFSVLLLISFYSYLQTWKDDDQFFEKGFFALLFEEKRVSNITGRLGGWFSFVFIKIWFGYASFLLIPLIFITGLKILGFAVKRFYFTISILFLFTLFFSLLFAAILPSDEFTISSGAIGYRLSQIIISYLGTIGFYLFLFLVAFILLSVTLPRIFLALIEKLKTARLPKISRSEKREKEHQKGANQVLADERTKSFTHDEIILDEIDEEEEIKIIPQPVIEKNQIIEVVQEKIPEELEPEIEQEIEVEELKTSGVPFEITQQPSSVINEEFEPQENDNSIKAASRWEALDASPYEPRKELSDFILPTHDLLEEHGKTSIVIDKEELEANKTRIEKTLQNYGINIDKIVATVGPTVTLYEIVPAAGIRISRIKNLEDDIALSLAALGIRIIAPIPGKGTIGIEVPNKNPEIVSLKSIVSNSQFINTKFDLPIALGKTITNDVYIADLAKMPHLLMAGATGQGKSVGLNAIIASLLFKKHPTELKFVLVDPKKVELPLFSKIERHYLAKLPDAEEAIITDTSQVVKTLKALTIEMNDRYNLLKAAQLRNIKEYNEKFCSRRLNPNDGHKFLPYIVLIIDEFADLIMTAGKEIEGPITRLAQLARAIGIHLVIATQRPSVNIITGIIKANFPVRMAFRVSAKVDSRTILDTSGADQLIGRGDMLLSTGSNMLRLQCAFIDTPELEEITEFIGNQRAFPETYFLPEVITEEDENRKEIDSEGLDSMFAEAARIIVQNQHGSTSLLQRKLKLGYNRAGRLIDQLEAAGVVGPFEGSKARDVLIRDMDSLEQLLRQYDNSI